MAASPRHDEVPLAVWPVVQTTVRRQRSGRCVASATQPVAMVPALARRIVETYSAPGALVVDPWCGAGTTLVEGAELGRRCIGVQRDQHWATLARATLDDALSPSQRRLAEVRVGEAVQLAEVLADMAGAVDLIAAAPPSGRSIDKPERPAGGRFCDPATSADAAEVSDPGRDPDGAYEAEMAAAYAACHAVLRPGGLLVAVTRNLRRQARFLDLAEATVRLARAAGFTYLQHVVGLVCAVRNGELVAGPSAVQRTQTRRARASGLPVHLLVHHDVVVLRKEGGRG